MVKPIEEALGNIKEECASRKEDLEMEIETFLNLYNNQ